ncbi:OmpA family protein [Parasulfitobacter algicola]|uniref:OmpA family protein n=1 Tax=Parasulfitobacter algicola TaxID=2614809 RepID=A0ABX2INX1_9RHOB|nr:OmpA family protein [Sulfitobacter algicola]NSX54050.1 OmpA family protein [Sulfitobacter algicola]
MKISSFSFCLGLALISAPAWADLKVTGDGDVSIGGMSVTGEGDVQMDGMSVGSDGDVKIGDEISIDSDGDANIGGGLSAGSDGNVNIGGALSAGADGNVSIGDIEVGEDGSVVMPEMRVESDGSVSMGSEFETSDMAEALEQPGAVINVSILFASGSAELTDDGRAQVKQVADAMFMLDDGVRVLIEGHTDSVGSDADNFALSNARSQTVMNELLLKHDVEVQLLSGGKGETSPVADNGTAIGRSLNRRVTFTRN